MTLTYQSDFHAAVLDAHQPVPSYIEDHRAQPTPKRFGVYRNNVVVSLVEALCSGFPSLIPLVGEDFFKAVAREYATKNPPTSPVMLFYGAGFPTFLDGFEPTQRLPFLPHVAQIDWAWRQAYHAADARALTAQDIATVAPEELETSTVTLHPSLWFDYSPYPAFDLWQVGRGLLDQSQVTSQSQATLVTRPGLEVFVSQIGTGTLTTLQSLQAGQTLGAALETGLAADDTFDVAAFFQLVFDQGLIIALT